jgi:hypothetical protein
LEDVAWGIKGCPIQRRHGDLVVLHLRPLEIERLTIAIRFSYSDHGLSQAKGIE